MAAASVPSGLVGEPYSCCLWGRTPTSVPSPSTYLPGTSRRAVLPAHPYRETSPQRNE